MAADWLSRFATLNWLGNRSGLRAENTTTSTIRPRMAGSDPRSPPRTLVT